MSPKGTDRGSCWRTRALAAVLASGLAHAQSNERASVATGGTQGDEGSRQAAISTDGRFVVFTSYATNFAAGDAAFGEDGFVNDRLSGATEVANVSIGGTPANSEVGVPPVLDFCFGDGSGASCPCANSGAAGRGCENSSGTGGALLTDSGSPTLSADTFVLTASGEKPTAFSIFLQGNAQVAPALFGDGLRCVGGVLKRLYSLSAVGGVVTAPTGVQPTISARSAALGDTIPIGGTRYYQTYYRDPNLGFCPNPPGNSWNVSNALSAVWSP